MTGSLLRIIGGRLNKVIQSLHLVCFVLQSEYWCQLISVSFFRSMFVLVMRRRLGTPLTVHIPLLIIIFRLI